MVSVVIPAYNIEKYIQQCLDSVLLQTEVKYEVIIINDGSTDRTGEICSRYQEQYENFKCISQKNSGISVARNYGINAARGKYIFFLDGDDYLPRGSLKHLVEVAENERIDVIRFSVYSFLDGTDDLEWDETGYKFKGNYNRVYSGKEYLKEAIHNGDAYFVNCGHIFLNTDFAKANKLYFVPGILHEDNIYNWEMMMLAQRVYILNEPLSCRRYRSGSIMLSGNWPKRIEALTVTIAETYNFIDEHEDVSFKDAKWFLKLYGTNILNFWLRMTPNERKENDVKPIIDKARKLMIKHWFWGKVNIALFAMNPNLYGFYHKMNMIIRKNEEND